MHPKGADWLWFALPSMAMSLGWGLRGYIGGGPLGAMIPGAMVALVLAALLRQSRHAAWLAASGALGIGLGGQMTYGQTVGLSLRPETFWWAMLGFALKGGAWGLAGGAIFGAALLRDRPGYSARRFLAALAAMVAATWSGWYFIHAPKLAYFFFSDPFNKPREEIWAGLILGALAFLILTVRGPHRGIVWRFTVWPCLAGAAGFPLGAALQVWGRRLEKYGWVDWWKGMEFTFGVLLGLGFGIAAWRSRAGLAQEPAPPVSPPSSGARSLLTGAAAAATVIGIEYLVPLRFNFSLAASLALGAALWSPPHARHFALTVTVTAFVLDLVDNKPALAGAAGWAVVLAAAAAPAAWARRERPAQTMLAFLMWSAVGVSLLKTFLPPPQWSPGHLLTEAVFALMAFVCQLWIRALPESPPPAPSGAAAVAS